MGRAKKSNKAIEWKTLTTLVKDYDKSGRPLDGPAFQTIYGCLDGRYRFSHTPGIIVGGSFRSVQHIHDRHGEIYLLLLMDALGGVVAAMDIGMSVIESNLQNFEVAVRRAQKTVETLEKVGKADSVLAGEPVSERRLQYKAKPSRLTASLGDMLKAKGESL